MTAVVMRQTCSRVTRTCGFFFPELVRMTGDESEDDERQDQVSDQAGVLAALEVRQADFGFRDAEIMFDGRPPKRGVHPQPKLR